MKLSFSGSHLLSGTRRCSPDGMFDDCQTDRVSFPQIAL